MHAWSTEQGIWEGGEVQLLTWVIWSLVRSVVLRGELALRPRECQHGLLPEVLFQCMCVDLGAYTQADHSETSHAHRYHTARDAGPANQITNFHPNTTQRIHPRFRPLNMSHAHDPRHPTDHAAWPSSAKCRSAVHVRSGLARMSRSL